LDDWPGDGESAGVGAYGDAGDADHLPDDDGVERHDFVDDELAVGWPEAHCEYANEGEEADVEGWEIVGWGGEQEG